MQQSQSVGEYLIISPIKDEEKYVETTILGILRQKVRPTKWVIVDDGSEDRTPEILNHYAKLHDWIQVLRIERDVQRQPGSAVIRAFNVGYEHARGEKFRFIVKLDCDLELPTGYFRDLLTKFEKEPKLGIASGVYTELWKGEWVAIRMPSYHAAGASKMLRKECFEDIGGFVPSRGWDTVDEIRAQAKGWSTCHFESLQFRHLKTEGSGIGMPKTNIMHGEIFYLTGGGGVFFALKVLHRMLLGQPFLLGGLYLLRGYLSAWARHTPRLITNAEFKFYRKQLNRRIFDRIARICIEMKSRMRVWRYN
jgi:glycosyltransferase involved in cell wall biosynthesis